MRAHTTHIITWKSVLCKYQTGHPLTFLLQLSAVFHLPICPSPLLPPSLSSFFPFCVLLSPCCIHLCTINLPANELELLTLSLLLSAAAVPYLCSIFLLLLLTQPCYCCSIDQHVISYMNNASSETKIVALLGSLGWDLFCNHLTECIWLSWFLFSSASYFVKWNRDFGCKGIGTPKAVFLLK